MLRLGLNLGLSSGSASLPKWWDPTAYADYQFNESRYMLGGSIIPEITAIDCARASSGNLADTLSAIWKPFAANIPRATNKGVLIEEIEQNFISSNDGTGAVVGTTTLPTDWVDVFGGLPPTVDAIGTESGVDYVDLKFTGTPTVSPHIRTGDEFDAAGVSGDTFSSSIFMKIVSGDMTNIDRIETRIVGTDAIGTFLESQTTTVAVDGNLTRFLDTLTISNASTTNVHSRFRLIWTSGAIDITLRIGLPTLEKSAAASSPIVTSGAVATRQADNIRIDGIATAMATATDNFSFQIDFEQLESGAGKGGATLFDIRLDSTSRVFATYLDGNGDLSVFWRIGGVDVSLTIAVSFLTLSAHTLTISFVGQNMALNFDSGAVDSDVDHTETPDFPGYSIAYLGSDAAPLVAMSNLFQSTKVAAL